MIYICIIFFFLFLFLYRGIVKLFQNIFPNNYHGNLLKGIAVIDGEGKLFNMRCGKYLLFYSNFIVLLVQ